MDDAMPSPFSAAWIAATKTRLRGTGVKQRATWEKAFLRFVERFEAGQCWCRRPLLDGRCAESGDGCGNAPLNLGKKQWSASCQCTPLRPDEATPRPTPLFAATVLTMAARDTSTPTPKPWLTQDAARHKNTFVKAVHDRIRRNLNANIIFYGAPGSRKSYSCLRWCEEFDHSFRGVEALNRLIYSYADCVRWLSSGHLTDGQAAVIDEGGPLFNSRASASAMNRYLSDVFTTNRQDRNIICLCVPTLEMLDVNVKRLAHYLVRCVGGPATYAVNIVERVEFKPAVAGLGGEWHRELLRHPVTKRPIRWFGVAKPQYIPMTPADGSPNYEDVKFKARQDLDAKWGRYFARLEKYQAQMIEEVSNESDTRRLRALKPTIGA